MVKAQPSQSSILSKNALQEWKLKWRNSQKKKKAIDVLSVELH
jgi:hypothetical protein